MSGDSPQITVVTSTFYKAGSQSDHARRVHALTFAERAKTIGVKVVAVDGGSENSFIEALRRTGADVLTQTGKTMGSARRQAIQHALDIDSKILIYTELEKSPIIEAVDEIVSPILKNESDIVVVGRRSIKSYPWFQQELESIGNKFFKALTDYDFDLWFGPRAWAADSSNFFLDYSGEYGDTWDCIFIPLIDAIHDGAKLSYKAVDYIHPQIISDAEGGTEFWEKRTVQLQQLTHALVERWRTGPYSREKKVSNI